MCRAPRTNSVRGMTSITAPVPRVNTPLKLLGATAHMAIMGFVGIAVFSILVTLLSAGVGTIPVLVGAPILVFFVYALYGAAWFETARVEGLYGFGMPMLKPRRSPKRGFVGFLHTLWLQFIDAGQWRAIAHLAIVTVLGLISFAAVAAFAGSAAAAFAPLYAPGATARILGIPMSSSAAPAIGAVVAVLALALLFGLALLHGAISRVLIAPIREAQLAAAARDASVQRSEAIRASDVERTRLERDLHDGVQPRLVSVGMTLGLAQTKIDSDPEKAKELLAEAHTSTKAAITELRQLARGIHASVLDDRGLDAALSAVASRSHIPVTLDVRMPERVGRDAEAAVYFAIAESLTNAAKHSRATGARVTVRVRPETGQLWARVEDNGVGGARVLPGGGLDGIIGRIAALGGTSRLDSPAGGPTSLEVSVPCAS